MSNNNGEIPVMVNALGVTKKYCAGTTTTVANNNISFSIRAGDIVWVTGRSGSGKTTLMNMVSGLDTPTSGQVQFLDADFSYLSDARKTCMRRTHMGLIFQHFELLPMLNGYENINVPFLLGASAPERGSKKASRSEIDRLVSRIRPDVDFLHKKVTRISGGQRQVISIVRALIHNPLFLLGDEITSNLDVVSSKNVYALLQSYIAERGGAGMFISHDPIIREYCTRIFYMEDGMLQEQS